MREPSMLRTGLIAFTLSAALLASCSDDDDAGGVAAGGVAAGMAGRAGSGGSSTGGSSTGGSSTGGSSTGGSSTGGSSGASSGTGGGGGRAGTGGTIGEAGTAGESGSGALGGSGAGRGGLGGGSGGTEAGSSGMDAGAGGEGGAAVETSGVVTPEGGGMITDGTTTVIVPPGAVSVSTTIRIATVEPSTVADVPSEFEGIGPTVALLPHGLTFAQPVEVVLHHTSAMEPARPAVLRLDDESDTSWENVAWPVADATSLHFMTTRFSVLTPAQFAQASCDPPLTISVLYAAGGLNQYQPNNDFVELHNREASTLVLDGVALQLNDGAASGAWTVIPLTGTIPPSGFYAVVLGRDNQVTGTALPGADLVSNANLPTAGGLVALTVGTQPLSGSGPWKIVSGLSYGTTSLSLEGTPAPAPTQPTQTLRSLGRGCTWTHANSADFYLANPLVPFNTGSAPMACTCP